MYPRCLNVIGDIIVPKHSVEITEFSGTQILREIKVDEARGSKSAI